MSRLSTGTSPLADARITVPMLLIGSIRVWAAMGQVRMVDTTAGLDSGLYLRLADHLVQGRWLGPYDATTLVRPPGYPLWIATNHAVGWPLYFAENLLYVGACALLVLSVWPVLGSRLLGVGLFALLAFNPMSYGPSALEYMRDSIYPAQTLLVLACAIGLLVRIADPPLRWLAWSWALGGSLGFFWLTREESVWLLPPLAVALAWAMGRLRSRGVSVRRGILSAAVAALVPVALAAAIAAKNRAEYGVFTTSEIRRAEFVAAHGALARVGAAWRTPGVPVPREARQRIYEASPAFRELEGYFEGVKGEAWSTIRRRAPEPGFRQRPRIRTRRSVRDDIGAGFFRFALRDAVREAGHHASAPAAMAFYQRLAEEVLGAIDAGVLPAGRASVGFLPVLEPADLGPVLTASAAGAWWAVSFRGFSAVAHPSQGGIRSHERVRELTGDRLSPNQYLLARGELDGGDPKRIRLLSGVALAYQWASPVLWALALIGLVVAAARRRLPRASLGVAGILFLALSMRLILLALVEASAFPAIRLRYLAPVYPLGLACAGLILVGILQADRTAVRHRNA